MTDEDIQRNQRAGIRCLVPDRSGTGILDAGWICNGGGWIYQSSYWVKM